MKIGIISDIHADPTALDKALSRLRDKHQVDMILCAGDLTGYGNQPNDVIDRLRTENIPTVKGNHDSPSSKITPDNADFLRKLPMS